MGSSIIKSVFIGITGPTGPTGPIGPAGPTGVGSGLTGITGITGVYVTNIQSYEDSIEFRLSDTSTIVIAGTKGPTGYTGTLFAENTGEGLTLYSYISGATLAIRGLSFFGNLFAEVTGNSILVTPLDVSYGVSISSGITTQRVVFSDTQNTINSTRIVYGKTYGDFSFASVDGITTGSLHTFADIRGNVIEIPSGGNVTLNVSDGVIFKLTTPIGLVGFTLSQSVYNTNELISFTMFVDGAGFSQFPENVFFEDTPYSSYFGCGTNIVNIMSPDNGSNWYARIIERGYDVSGCSQVQGIGSCCYITPSGITCAEYVSSEWCLGKTGTFNLFTTCCSADCFPEGSGICCLEGNCSGVESQSECNQIGGKYYAGLTCDVVQTLLGGPEQGDPGDDTDPDNGDGGDNTQRQCYNANLPPTVCCTGGQCISETTWKICVDYYHGVPFTGTCCEIDCSANPPTRSNGACCIESNDQCIQTTYSGCSAAGGLFYGNGTTCGGVNCCFDSKPSLGSCCSPVGCFDNYTEHQCTSDNGNFSTQFLCEERDCPTSGLTGVCCLPAGCSDNSGAYYTASQCQSAGGTFYASPSNCSTVVCNDVTRPCCLPNGTCLPPIPTTVCSNFGGTSVDNCSSCPPPPIVGACCATDGTCQDNVLATNCTDPNIFHPSTICFNNPCNTPSATGACCLPDGSCEIKTDIQCGLSSGQFYNGSVCAEINCTDPPITGACCRPDGCDNDVPGDNCEFENFHANKNCDEVTCIAPPQTGACCLNGNCIYPSTKADCQGGFYPGLTCGVVDCSVVTTGACCLPGNSCQNNQTREECEGAGGSWRGTGTLCDTEDCTTPIISSPNEGLCCINNLECAVRITREACHGLGASAMFFPNLMLDDKADNLYQWDINDQVNDCEFCNLKRHALLVRGYANPLDPSGESVVQEVAAAGINKYKGSVVSMQCYENGFPESPLPGYAGGNYRIWDPRKISFIEGVTHSIEMTTTMKLGSDFNSPIFEPACGSVDVAFQSTGTTCDSYSPRICMKDSFLAGQIYVRKYHGGGGGGDEVVERFEDLFGATPPSQNELRNFIYGKYMRDIRWVWGDYNDKLKNGFCKYCTIGPVDFSSIECTDDTCADPETGNDGFLTRVVEKNLPKTVYGEMFRTLANRLGDGLFDLLNVPDEGQVGCYCESELIPEIGGPVNPEKWSEGYCYQSLHFGAQLQPCKLQVADFGICCVLGSNIPPAPIVVDGIQINADSLSLAESSIIQIAHDTLGTPPNCKGLTTAAACDALGGVIIPWAESCVDIDNQTGRLGGCSFLLSTGACCISREGGGGWCIDGTTPYTCLAMGGNYNIGRLCEDPSTMGEDYPVKWYGGYQIFPESAFSDYNKGVVEEPLGACAFKSAVPECECPEPERGDICCLPDNCDLGDVIVIDDIDIVGDSESLDETQTSIRRAYDRRELQSFFGGSGNKCINLSSKSQCYVAGLDKTTFYPQRCCEGGTFCSEPENEFPEAGVTFIKGCDSISTLVPVYSTIIINDKPHQVDCSSSPNPCQELI